MAVGVQETFDFVPAHLVVQAMRDSGYKNAAYAVAELMDNSIQAGAGAVELLCAETELKLEQRRRRRVDQIAVLDDGSGMDATTLRMALQFGNGRFREDVEGMGKFGMGLPNSSVSQCRRVDVWSWFDGPDSAIHSYLDIDDILNERVTQVPEPDDMPIPEMWRVAGNTFSRSGTLVVWSRLDRIMWRTASSIIRNCEFLIGRMYRRFLNEGRVAIRTASFLSDSPSTIDEEELARPNDPLYLMAGTSTPEPYDDQPMFQPYGGDSWEVNFDLRVDDDTHRVTVRFTYAKEEAREARPGEPDPGARQYGRHAARNVGISLMRSGRELDLDTTLTIPYDPVERWWGVEVEFPPALDELFGVTNNKQSARNFTDACKLDLSTLMRGAKSIVQVMEEMREDSDPLAPLLEIVHRIDTTLRTIRRLLQTQTRHTRGRRRHDRSAEAQATTATKERQEEGHTGQSDFDEDVLSPEDRQKEIERELVEEGVPTREAHERAYETVSSGLKYVFNVAEIESSAFFSVKPRAGTIFVTLNSTHPAYRHLVEILEYADIDEEASAEDLRGRLENANRGLKLVLAAWARYEDEQPSDRLREQAQDIRTDWGRVARQFLSLER
jgi:hypothetical protein